MALNVNNQILLKRLAFGGVASNELFYHSSCYKSLEYENDRILKENDDNDSESWAKAFALNKVVTYLYEENEKSPGQIFSVNILKKKIYRWIGPPWNPCNFSCHEVYSEVNITS